MFSMAIFGNGFNELVKERILYNKERGSVLLSLLVY